MATVVIGTEETNTGALRSLSGAVLSTCAGLYEARWLTPGRESAGAVSLVREGSFITDITENCRVIMKSRTILVSFIMNFEVLYR